MKKLTSRGQMFWYACAAMGVNLLNLMMGSYLCSALLIGGFGEAAIKNQTFAGTDLVIAGAWAVFALIAKIIDGVIDIPMASITDNLKSRYGRRRPTLLIGLIALIASYCAFALITPGALSANWLNTVYYAITLCVFYTAYTLTMVTYYATFTEIVDNEQDRNFISNVKSVCDIVYFIVGYVVVAALLKGFNIRLVALVVLPLVLLMLIPMFMIKEPSTLKSDAPKQKTVNIFKSLAYTFKDRNFIVWMCVYSFMTFGVQLFLSGINEYFSVTGMSMIYVMVAAFVPVPLTLTIYNKLMRKKGFRFAFNYVLITFGIAMASLFAVSFLPNGTLKIVPVVGEDNVITLNVFFLPNALKTVLSVVGGLISSLAVGALFSVAYSVPSQLAAEDEARTGITRSAMYFAVQGLFAGVATGIGGSALLTGLKTWNASYLITIIAAAAMVVAGLLTVFLPKSVANMGKIDKKSDETSSQEPAKE